MGKSKREKINKEYEELFNKGIIANKRGDFKQGLSYFKQASRLVDDDPELYCNLGSVLLSIGEYKKAKSQLNRALALDPYFPLALMNLAALVSLVEGEYDEGIRILEKLLSRYPDYQQALPLLMKIKRLKSLLGVEVKNIPNKALNLLEKGINTVNQGKLREAFTLVSEAIIKYPQFAEAYQYLGIIEKESQNHQSALEYFNKALELDPNLSISWVHMGTIYFNQGLHNKAIQCNDKAIELNPNDSSAYNNKGLALASLGSHETAIKYYNKSIELNPDYEGAYNNRALSYEKTKQYERAIADYMKILELNPRDDYSIDRIESFKQLIIMNIEPTFRIVSDARDYCPRCRKKNYVFSEKCPYCRTPMLPQETIEDLLQKVIEYEDLGDFEEAIMTSIRINQRKPTLAKAWFYRSKAHAALGEFDIATLCSGKSHRLGISFDDQIEKINDDKYSLELLNNLNEFKNPNLSEENLATIDVKKHLGEKMTDYGIVTPNEKLWSSLGAFYQMRMKYEKAYKCYKNVLKINENYWIAKKNVELIEKLAQKQIVLKPIDFFNKGMVFCQQNRLEEAIQSFDKALKLDPKYKIAWYYKALTLNQIGRFDEAIIYYGKALALDPNYKDAWNSKGISLDNLGRHEEALQAYENAINIDPHYKEAWNNKGIDLDILGKLEEALQAYNRVLELDPYFKQAWENKEFTLKQAGRNEEARKVHNQALKLGIYDI